MEGLFNYDTRLPSESGAIAGYRFTSGIVVGLLFAVCTALLVAYKLNKGMTIQMADELAERRKKFAPQARYA